jgi:hypothetical protein
MQLLFSKFALLMVMFHMAIGCQWHHGLGEAGECRGHCGVAVSDHDHTLNFVTIQHDCHHQHGCPQHNHDDRPTGHAALDCDLNDSDSGHPCCCNDRCSVAQTSHFELAALIFFNEYLGGAENAALAGMVRVPSSTFDTTSDFSHTARKMRAHLLINVLII